jgi:putative hemolysin
MEADIIPPLCSILFLLLLVFSAVVDMAAALMAKETVSDALRSSIPRRQDFARLLSSPKKAAMTALVLEVTSLVGGAVCVYETFSVKTLYPYRIWALVALALITAALEVGARAYFARSPKKAADQLGWLVKFFVTLLVPVTLMLKLVERLIYGKRSGELVENLFMSEDGIRFLLDLGSEGEEPIEAAEREMIDNIIEFKETIVREIMVPRLDIVALPEDTSLHDALDLIIKAGHSRIPVYRESIDHIVGILYAKDLLVWMRDNRKFDLKETLRSPYFVPETKKVYDLLREMQKSHIHLAIVVDEYGGVAGLVTIEDLLEEIVGEIQDEYDQQEIVYAKKVDENTYIFDARILIEDVNELMGSSLSSEGGDTLGGFIYSQLGRIPVPGEIISYDGLNLEVLSISGQRILKVRVTKKPSGEKKEDAPGGHPGIPGILSLF